MSATAKSASKIMLAVMGSRILGLVREIILNAIFGAGKELDAFIAAFRFPNLLRDLFAEGALSTAFVTTFSKKLATEGEKAAFRLANLVFSSMTLILTIIVVLGMLCSGWIVQVITPGFFSIPGKAELTTQLTSMMFPFILLVSLAAVYMGLLNSLGSFGLPASASTIFNATSIVCGLAIGYLFDPKLGPRAIYGFAIGTLLGGFMQLYVQIPHAKKRGFVPHWMLDWKDEGLRQVFFLTLPAVLGNAAVQVNVLVNTYFASYLGDGAVTWLNNAFRLMQLPIGMFGVAISMVTLPSVSRSAAQADFTTFRSKVVEGIRLALFLTIPSSIGLAVLAEPIISIIYQRGAFTPFDTQQTAIALQAYTVGLAGYACIKVLAPTFYALDMPSVPVRISTIGIALNIGFNLFFMHVLKLGIMGLPLSTSLVAIINFLQLTYSLRKKLGSFDSKNLLIFLIKLVFVSAIMGVSVFYLQKYLTTFAHGHWLQLLLLLSCILVGVAAFGLSAKLAQLQEMQLLVSYVRKKLKK